MSRCVVRKVVVVAFVVVSVYVVEGVDAFGREKSVRSASIMKKTSDNVSASSRRPAVTLSAGSLAIAGAIATMVGDAALHPIDCIKTLQQSNDGFGLNMVAAAKKIYSVSGIGGFFSGMGCYVASDGMAGAIKFSTYEGLKKWVYKNAPEQYEGAAIFLCAGLAFVASSFVLVPGELIKQRMQMGQVSSISNGISTIWNTQGLKGFYTGYAGVCLRDIPYTMLELGLYDNLKSLYLTFKNRNLTTGHTTTPITQFDEIVAAAITGGITGYISNPLDLIKTKLMVDSTLYTGFFDAFSKTVKEHGVASLFHGGAARVAWLMPFTAIYLPVYDIIKRKMTTPAIVKNNQHTLQMRGGTTITTQTLPPFENETRSYRKHGLFDKKQCFVCF